MTICVVFMLFNKLNLMQVSRGNILKTTGMLCNPNFICKNNWCFDLSSVYFLYPLTSLPKMVKTGNAYFCQAGWTLCFSDHVLVLLCLLRSIKGKCLLGCAWLWSWCWEKNTERSSVQQGKPDPWDLWRP